MDDDDRPAQRAAALTDLLGWLFARGHAADVVIAVMAVELAWLTGPGRWPAGAAVLRLLPGALMVLALRGALTGADWPRIALPLALAFPPHVADLIRGAPRRPKPAGRTISSPSDRR